MAVAAPCGAAESARRAVGVALLALLAAAPRAEAQGSIHGVDFRADLSDGRAARVSVDVTLSGLAPGDSVAVRLLDFGEGIAGELRVGAAEAPATLARLQGAARGGTFAVEEGPAGGALLRARYVVPLPDGRGGVTVHLPVLTVTLPPEEPRAGLFRAHVTPPPGWVVTEGFPTGLAAVGGAGILETDLQVVPSVVTLRARTDGDWRPGLPLVLDGVALVGLLLFAVAGWRHLRATA